MAIYIIANQTYNINAANLFVGILSQETSKFYQHCTFSLLENKFIKSTPGVFASSFDNANFRQVSFANQANLDTLDYHLIQAQERNQLILLGTHDKSNLEILKQRYGQECLCIGTVWETDSYDFLIKNVAEYHCYFNKIPYDQVSFYQQQLDQGSYVPDSYLGDYDYTISVRDFFDIGKMMQHARNILGSVSNSSENFYKTWLQNYAAEL